MIIDTTQSNVKQHTDRCGCPKCLHDQVDKGILPLVNFLDDFGGIVTQWSCEGHSGVDIPYVDFYAEDFESILFLLKEMEGAPCSIVVQYDHESFTFLRFAIHFENKEHLSVMIKWIKECWLERILVKR